MAPTAMEQLEAIAKAKPRAKRAPKPFGEVRATTVRHFPTQATNTNLIISKPPKAAKEPKAPKEKKVATTTPKEKKPRAPRVKKVAEALPLAEGEVKIEKKPRKKADPNAPKKPRAKMPADQARCMKCKKGVSCAGCKLVEEGGRKRLVGNCPTCDTAITKFVSKDYVKP